MNYEIADWFFTQTVFKMSAPILKSLRLYNLLKGRYFDHAGRKIQGSLMCMYFSEGNTQTKVLQQEENVSNNSLNARLPKIDDIEQEADDSVEEKSSYVKVFEKLDRLRSGVDSMPAPSNKTFATLLRESKLMQLGDISGKVVVGEIFEIHGDDLYIDFGGKFYCVCPKPQLMPWKYTRSTKVKVHLHNLEMSSKFLGSEQHVTLLEADGTLLGLYDSEIDSKESNFSLDLNR